MSYLLNVNELFVSIQCEGFWTGTPATFLRLQGCNLSCSWCDTKGTWDGGGGTEMEVREVLHHIACYVPKTVVVTGGEPLLQQEALNALIRLDKSKGYHHKWHVETNGTCRVLSNLWDWVTVSPKPPEYKMMKSAKLAADEVKVVVLARETIAIAHEMAKDPLMAGADFCLQPMNNDPAPTEQAVQYLIQTPEPGRRRWRLSMQVHKYIGVR